jgi:methanogenic corrinoid protein MtbC1
MYLSKTNPLYAESILAATQWFPGPNMSTAASDPRLPDPEPGWLHIAEVERETGLGKDTLRVWERRYGFPRPRRNARGERTYDPAQVAQLRLIKGLLDAGYRPGQVVGRPLSVLKAMRSAVAVKAAEAAPWSVLLEWVRNDEPQRVRAALREVVHTRGLATAVEDWVAPLCVAVGEAWARGELAVYQEHWLTESVQAVLREGIAALEAAPGYTVAAPRVVLATAPGEWHQLGLLMAECFLALEGADRLSLGVSTPLADMVAAAAHSRADVVAISVSAHATRREVRTLVAQLRAQLNPAVALWVGGAAARRDLRRPPPGVWVLGRASEAADAVRRWRLQSGFPPSRG